MIKYRVRITEGFSTRKYKYVKENPQNKDGNYEETDLSKVTANVTKWNRQMRTSKFPEPYYIVFVDKNENEYKIDSLEGIELNEKFVQIMNQKIKEQIEQEKKLRNRLLNWLKNDS